MQNEQNFSMVCLTEAELYQSGFLFSSFPPKDLTAHLVFDTLMIALAYMVIFWGGGVFLVGCPQSQPQQC